MYADFTEKRLVNFKLNLEKTCKVRTHETLIEIRYVKSLGYRGVSTARLTLYFFIFKLFRINSRKPEKDVTSDEWKNNKESSLIT